MTRASTNAENFSTEQIQLIWQEVWKSGGADVKEPALDALSEQQVVTQMAGTWRVMFGTAPDLLFISLGTNREMAVAGVKEGKPWKKAGQWKVIASKLVLFLKEDKLPGFVFVSRGKTWIFDPWARTMMSEMQLEPSPEELAQKAGNSSGTNNVFVLQDPTGTRNMLELALEQLTRGPTNSLLKTQRPVAAVSDALPEIQAVAERPIVAATEFKGWFWYATAVARDAETKGIRSFIAGYAVRKGGRDVLKWSVW